jgi:hypothetical protein
MTLWLKVILAGLTLAGGIFTYYISPKRRAAKKARERERKRYELEKAACEGDDDTVARLMAELLDELSRSES